MSQTLHAADIVSLSARSDATDCGVKAPSLGPQWQLRRNNNNNTNHNKSNNHYGCSNNHYGPSGPQWTPVDTSGPQRTPVTPTSWLVVMSVCRTRAQFAELLVALPIRDLAVAVTIEDGAACRAALLGWARLTMGAHTEPSDQSLGITRTVERTHFPSAGAYIRPNGKIFSNGPHQDLVEAACSFCEER